MFHIKKNLQLITILLVTNGIDIYCMKNISFEERKKIAQEILLLENNENNRPYA